MNFFSNPLLGVEPLIYNHLGGRPNQLANRPQSLGRRTGTFSISAAGYGPISAVSADMADIQNYEELLRVTRLLQDSYTT